MTSLASVPNAFTDPKTAHAENPLANVSDDRIRTAFEKTFVSPRTLSFARGNRGSYLNDRLEARYQGFKLAVEGIVSERVSLFALTGVEKGIYDRA